MPRRYLCPKCQGTKCKSCNGYGVITGCIGCDGRGCIWCGNRGYMCFTTGKTGHKG